MTETQRRMMVAIIVYLLKPADLPNDVVEHELLVVSKCLEGYPDRELATPEEANLVNRLGELAERSLERSDQTIMMNRRKMVFTCWILCGIMDAWHWDPQTIWEMFEKVTAERAVGPVDSLRDILIYDNTLKFIPPCFGARRRYNPR
ncbi:hypothetical protein N7532_006914 [Penicillium argentinense]|uniref:Uncharacterized protein n=1 Tax=Penicillium argentinense TaxID=1131581 RepID=A0A9W9KBD6_9EURO|nr:uncharacterized protein N7532_006914 [Penicillium argentinense]KAJ5099913.1 hypothetical protein N7532_006914 [Penicillium argentinense]